MQQWNDTQHLLLALFYPVMDVLFYFYIFLGKRQDIWKFSMMLMLRTELLQVLGPRITSSKKHFNTVIVLRMKLDLVTSIELNVNLIATSWNTHISVLRSKSSRSNHSLHQLSSHGMHKGVCFWEASKIIASYRLYLVFLSLEGSSGNLTATDTGWQSSFCIHTDTAHLSRQNDTLFI